MQKTSYDNEYKLYILFTKNEEFPINEYRLWNECVQALDPIVSQSSFEAEITSSQSIKNTGEFLLIGPLEWNYEGHKSWTANIQEKYGLENIDFNSTKIYFPGPEKWDNEDITPEIAIKIYSNSGSHDSRFDFAIMLAFQEEFIGKVGVPTLNTAIQKLSKTMNAVLELSKTRSWATRIDTHSYEDSLQDFFPTSILDSGEELALKSDQEGWIIKAKR